MGRRGKEGYERGEVIAAIGTIEAFWQDYDPCSCFGSFVNFLSCMYEIGGFVPTYSCPSLISKYLQYEA